MELVFSLFYGDVIESYALLSSYLYIAIDMSEDLSISLLEYGDCKGRNLSILSYLIYYCFWEPYRFESDF